MVAESKNYESLISANGPGSFSNIEYDDRGYVLLRTAEVKTTDLSGAVRLYFNAQRDQVLTGRRFDLSSSGLVLMRPGVFYRIQSTLEIVEPIPAGVYAQPVLHPDIADVMTITSSPLTAGYTGPVYFTVQPYRKIEAEKMTSFAGLLFHEEPTAEWVLSTVGSVATTAGPNRPKTVKKSE